MENTSAMLNTMIPGNTVNNITVAISYHFVRDHVGNNVVEARKIHKSEYFVFPITKPWVSNSFPGFYNLCMVNG